MTFQYSPIEYLPRRLRLEEINDPMIVLHKFFDWENLPEWRLHLDRWLKAGMTSGYQLNRDDLVELFVRYEFIEIFVEASWLICKCPGSFDTVGELRRVVVEKTEKIIPNKINTARGYFNNGFNPRNFPGSDYHPRYLDNDEKHDPFLVFRSVFEFHSLPQFRDGLNWWYLIGIDYTSADDSRGNDYLKSLYENIQKMIESAHLVYIRISNK